MNAITLPSSRAYNIVDHTYDVVVVGAGGSGLRATLGMGAAGLEDRLHHQGVPHPQPHRRRAGRRRRRARQHGRGRLALAHVRHREGVGLARRPGRHRIHVPRGGAGGVRAGAFRRAVQPHRGRQDLPAPVRRPHDGLRQGPPAMRACAAADRTGHAILHTLYQQSLKHDVEFFIEYFALDLIMDEEGVCRGVTAWNLEDGTHPSLPRADRGAGDRRLRPHLPVLHLGAYLHRRRQRHGAARRPAVPGHGVRAVPPDRHLPGRLPDHRGRPRRGRLPDQLRRRALHGALRADRQGPGQPRRGVALDDDRDQRGTRLRAEQGIHHAASGASRRRPAARAAAGHLRDLEGVRRRRRDQGADPGAADRALQHGRRADQSCTPRCCARPATIRTRWCPG